MKRPSVLTILFFITLGTFLTCIIVLGVENAVFKNQTEKTYKKEQLVQYIYSENDYSVFRTSDNDTVAVYRMNNVHVHDCWCSHLFTCDGTRVLVDSVPAIKIRIKKVQNTGSFTYHWTRKFMWNW